MHTMRDWKRRGQRHATRRAVAGVAVALAVVLGAGPAAVASPLAPGDVLGTAVGTCFDGKTYDRSCTAANDYAKDWVLAGDGQDAQITSTGRAVQNASCNGAYYLPNTIVSTLDLPTFIRTFTPAKSGMSVIVSDQTVPAGLNAFTIAGPYDAYAYAALLYRRQIDAGGAHAAGRVAPMYAPALTPAPKFGPGTMPVDATGSKHWTIPGGGTLAAKRALVVFDTSDAASKQDVAPADGWQDATAGHGVFVRGIDQAALGRGVPLVDITAFDSLVTEGTMATAIENYPFARNAVANLSAGTYYCTVLTKRAGTVPLTSVVLPQLVAWVTSHAVHLVAAAGNDASTRQFYPAAYGVEPTPMDLPVCTGVTDPATGLCLVDRAKSVTSVGSLLNLPAPGFVSYVTPAAAQRSPFSNYGTWVEAWADGSDVVSDYPDAAYDYCVPSPTPGTCESRGGGLIATTDSASAHLGRLVSWSGTSFATPQVAAWIAGGNPPP